MAKDFISYVRRPGDLLKRLRHIAIGGLIAAAGSTAAPSVATATPQSPPPDTLSPSIVDRARKGAKLVLRLPGAVSFLRAEHRSHRSHSSHRSHFSGSGGGSAPAAPPPARTPPVRTPSGSDSAVDLAAPSGPGIYISGEVVATDRAARTITVKQTATIRKVFAYRDDSRLTTASGVSVRFDEFAAENADQIPLATGDKVEVHWRLATDGKTDIITTIQKKP